MYGSSYSADIHISKFTGASEEELLIRDISNFICLPMECDDPVHYYVTDNLDFLNHKCLKEHNKNVFSFFIELPVISSDEKIKFLGDFFLDCVRIRKLSKIYVQE